MQHLAPNSVPEWLDLKGLTQYACVSERTLREWIHRHEHPLPASQVGMKLLVKRTDFDRWLEAHRVRPLETVDVGALVGEVLAELESAV